MILAQATPGLSLADLGRPRPDIYLGTSGNPAAVIDAAPLDPDDLAEYFRLLPRPSLYSAWRALVVDARCWEKTPPARLAEALAVVQARLCSEDGPDGVPPAKPRSLDPKRMPQHLSGSRRSDHPTEAARRAVSAAIPDLGGSAALRDIFRSGNKRFDHSDVNLACWGIKTGRWPEFRVELRPDPTGRSRNGGIRYAVRVAPDPAPAHPDTAP